jgi:hypothetical protein
LSKWLILDIIQETFPTEELTKAYFENLDALLRLAIRCGYSANVSAGAWSRA